MLTWKLRRRGAPCVIPFAQGEVRDGQLVDVPRGKGFEIPDPDRPGEYLAAPGWEFATPAAAPATTTKKG